MEEQAQLEADLIRLQKTRADQLRELLNREIELKNRIRAEEKAFQAEQDKLVDEAIAEELAAIDAEIAQQAELNKLELENFKKKEEEKTRIQQEEGEKRKQITQQVIDFAKDVNNTLLSFIQLANQKSLDAQLAAAGDNQERIDAIREEFAKKQKRAAIGQAVANGALAIVKAFSQLGPVAGAIAAATIAPTTALQIQTIRQQEFAQGGEVKAWSVSGPSHSQGGIPLHIGGNYAGEIEGNEGVYVVNKRDNAAAIAALSSINSVHGKSFAPRSYMQDGGEANVQAQTGISFEQALELAEARPIVVRVTDINDGQSTEARVVSNGTI